MEDQNFVKSGLSQLVEDALAGHEIIIARNGQPLIRLEVLANARIKSPASVA